MGTDMRKAAETFCDATCGAGRQTGALVVVSGCRDPPTTPFRGNLLVMDGCEIVANLTAGANATIPVPDDGARYYLAFELQELSRNSCDEPCLECYYAQVGDKSVTIGYGDDTKPPMAGTRAADGIGLNYEGFCTVWDIDGCPSAIEMPAADVTVTTICADTQLV